MTGYTVHTGSTEKFSEGWDRIFEDKHQKSGGKKSKPKSTGKSAGKKTSASAAKKKKAKNKQNGGKTKK